MDKYAAALPGCKGLGAKYMRALFDYFGSPEEVWKASDKAVGESHILGEKVQNNFLAYRKAADPDRIAEELYREEIRCAVWKQDEDYPSLLEDTSNPPAVLFYKGESINYERTIGIVGSRKATSYGIETARKMAEGLSKQDIAVISGGARGIDSASHRGALEGGGVTIAVAACGLDRVYPPENKELFREIIKTGGAVVSEYPLKTPPLGRQFPARNRIIAGMSRGILVVEAGERSGSLITSDFALEEGRDVFSVPGSIWVPSSRGTNQLIRSGAICCTSYRDILQEYEWGEEKQAENKKVFREQLTLEEELVYRFCCTDNEVSGEDILQQSGLSVVRLTVVLLQLQIKGYIKEVGPSRYIVIK